MTATSVLEDAQTGQPTTAAAVLGPEAFSGHTAFPPTSPGYPTYTPQVSVPSAQLPYSLQRKFHWGAFFLSWIWGLNHMAYITLIVIPASLVPYLGLPLCLALHIWFGFKGFEWAWASGRFQSDTHCMEVQQIWTRWGIGLFVATVLLLCLASLAATFIPLSFGIPVE